MKSNLILAFFSGYKFSIIEPFITSCLRCVSNAEIVFITDDKTETFELLSERRNIKTIHINNFETCGYHMLSERFFMYKKFLDNNYENYSNILICDVRDVFFQGNPFSVDRNSEVTFAAEDEILKNSDVNGIWIREFFGSDIYEEICMNTISCAGTTIGTAQGMMSYINDMCYQLKNTEHSIHIPFDQGIHNFLAWKEHRGIYAVDSEDTVFNTIGLTPRDKISIRDDLVLVDQKFSPVIHQWDRHENIRNFIEKSDKFKLF